MALLIFKKFFFFHFEMSCFLSSSFSYQKPIVPFSDTWKSSTSTLTNLRTSKTRWTIRLQWFVVVCDRTMRLILAMNHGQAMVQALNDVNLLPLTITPAIRSLKCTFFEIEFQIKNQFSYGTANTAPVTGTYQQQQQQYDPYSYSATNTAYDYSGAGG